MSEHFAPVDLRVRVEALLRSAGKDRSNTSIQDLAPLDQWHVEGLDATRRLARKAQIHEGEHVLAAACGMGGPARYLAEIHGACVTGIDLTEAYLETATLLNAFTGLQDRVTLQRADVTAIPAADATFDVVWTQNAAQSIPDKERFFAELFRVLKPGGRAVLHDLYRGPGRPVHFPAFWGRDDSISFLIDAASMRNLLEVTGFEAESWEDTTETAKAANVAFAEERADNGLEERGVTGLDICLLFGDETLVMATNSVKDFEVGSVGVFEAVLRRPT